MADINLNQLIQTNTIYQIKIVPPDNIKYIPPKFQIINGFLTNNLSFSGQNQWEGLHSGFRWMEDAKGNFVKTQAVLQEVTKSGNSDQGTYTIGGITETIARWQSAAKPTFAFNVMFIRLSPSDDIITPVKILLRGCLPMDASGEGIAKGTMQAPYGYKTGFSGQADDQSKDGDVGSYEESTTTGVWTVQVGKWFKAPKLVLSSVNVNFSQQCTPDGLPLYAECQLVFETWRLLKAGELDKFFLEKGRGLI